MKVHEIRASTHYRAEGFVCIIKSTGVRGTYFPTAVWKLLRTGTTRGRAIKGAINAYINAIYKEVKRRNNLRRSINL